MNENGVLHHKIKFNDRVYLVEDINDLLDKQKQLIDSKQNKIPEGTYQKKLIPGSGVEIKQDGTINCVLNTAVSNICKIKYINEGSSSEISNIAVDNDYHVYYATLSTASTSFSFSGFEDKAGQNAYTIELWVKIASPNLHVSFTGDNIVLAGDNNYTVDQVGQTIHFVIRYFNGTILINKYYVG